MTEDHRGGIPPMFDPKTPKESRYLEEYECLDPDSQDKLRNKYYIYFDDPETVWNFVLWKMEISFEKTVREKLHETPNHFLWGPLNDGGITITIDLERKEGIPVDVCPSE